MSDGLFLAGIVVLSAAPYVARLGFYSDDWAFLGIFSTAADQSFIGLMREQFTNPNLAMRPTQAAFQAVLFLLFGAEPLGYHVVNAVMLIAIALLLRRVLGKLSLPRSIAVAVPAVYVLMPNYSTTRFWFASFGYLLSMALYLLGLDADLRAASRDRAASTWRWKTASLAALIVAGLGFEVVLPFFVLNVVGTEVIARRAHPQGLQGKLSSKGRLLFHSTLILAVAASVVFKSSVGEGVGVGGLGVPRYLFQLTSGVLLANLGTFGVALPHTVGWSLPHVGLAGAASGVVTVIATYMYLGVVDRREGARTDLPPRRWWLRLGGGGVAVFALGYAIFLVTARIQFSSIGSANRVSTAGALGAGVILVSTVGWLATWVPSPRGRHRVLRIGVALLCGAGLVITNGVASFWAQSREVQQEVLTGLTSALPAPDPGSTLLLTGVCPYIGPGIVFESTWDLEGALRLHHRDRSLRADVAARIIALEPRGVVTRFYQYRAVLPFGDDLMLYDHRTGLLEVLDDEDAARHLLAPEQDEPCVGTPGVGAIVLPFDILFGWLQEHV